MMNEEKVYKDISEIYSIMAEIVRGMSTVMSWDEWLKMMNKIGVVRGLEEIKIEGKNDEASKNN